MKHSRIVSFACLLAVFLISSAPIQGVENGGLLTKDDLSHELEDRDNGPALSSAIDDPNPWATYNQWMCFDASLIRIEKVGVKFDKSWKSWPQITIATAGQEFDFSPATDRDMNAATILKVWESLLENSREVCLYAAFLQYLDIDERKIPISLWVLEDVKAESGYWHSDGSPMRQ